MNEGYWKRTWDKLVARGGAGATPASLNAAAAAMTPEEAAAFREATGAASGVIVGSLDASGGAYPASPVIGGYLITAAGTISGTAYDAGDLACWAGTAWARVPAGDTTAAQVSAIIAAATAQATPADTNEIVSRKADGTLEQTTVAHLQTKITGTTPAATGIAVLASSTQSAARTAIGVGEVLADVTLTATDLPTYAATADAGTDVVTLTGYSPTNGDAFYIEGSGKPTISGGDYGFVNEFTGPVVYAVNSSGNTCKLSATRGGAALDITNAGTSWTLRRASLQTFLTSGLSLGNGDVFLIEDMAPVGVAWVSTANSAAPGYQFNSVTTGYTVETVKAASISLLRSGNVQHYSRMMLTIAGSSLSGNGTTTIIYGTADSVAGSTPQVNNSSFAFFNRSPLTISTVALVPNGINSATLDLKLGHRFRVTRLLKGM